jgi:Ni/Fe-hydrogenase subunit HybB-like protein
VLFLTELALFTYPALRLLGARYRGNAGRVFWAAQLALMGGALYRFDTYLGAFMPGAGFRYFPSVGELLFSVGLAGGGVVLYLAIARALPILSGVGAARPQRARRGGHRATA